MQFLIEIIDCCFKLSKEKIANGKIYANKYVYAIFYVRDNLFSIIIIFIGSSGFSHSFFAIDVSYQFNQIIAMNNQWGVVKILNIIYLLLLLLVIDNQRMKTYYYYTIWKQLSLFFSFFIILSLAQSFS